jgi:hypothetical protein
VQKRSRDAQKQGFRSEGPDEAARKEADLAWMCPFCSGFSLTHRHGAPPAS